MTGRDVRDVNWRQAVPETWMTCTTRRAATAGTQLSRMLSHARAREENDMFRVLVLASLLSTRLPLQILVCQVLSPVSVSMDIK